MSSSYGRKLQPISVAVARIYGHKIGNMKALRTGNKVLRRLDKGEILNQWYSKPLGMFKLFGWRDPVVVRRQERNLRATRRIRQKQMGGGGSGGK